MNSPSGRLVRTFLRSQIGRVETKPVACEICQNGKNPHKTFEVHVCTESLLSVVDSIGSLIATPGEAFRETPMHCERPVVLGLVSADALGVGAISAGIEKFLHQCICALRDHLFAIPKGMMLLWRGFYKHAPSYHICTGVLGVVSADIEKFIHQCICAPRDCIFAGGGGGGGGGHAFKMF